MSFPILEHGARTARHTTFFLSCGDRRGRRRSSSCTPGRSCRSPGAVSFPCLAAGLSCGFARHARLRTFQHLLAPRRLCAGGNRRRHARAVRFPSGRRRRSGSGTIGARRSSGRSPSTIRNAVTASPTCVCPISRKGLPSRPLFRWPTGPSIRPTTLRPRNGIINCSTVTISRPRRQASRAT